MRRRLALALLAVPASVFALPSPGTAQAAPQPANPFDAYIASGDASCVELTVNVAGYSFIVQPDVRLPRATSTISEGQSAALAAPIDPGDSVDALPGLLVPREESQLASGIDSAVAQTKIPIPGDPGASVVNVVNPFNPALEYPVEHASASYPQPGSTAPQQQATYLGASNVAVADPSGVFSLDGTAGSARADAQSATADAGAGAALSVPLFGVSAGRFAVHAQSQVAQTAVSNDVSCSLGDLTIAPPGSGYVLHVASLSVSLHAERGPHARTATAAPSVHISGVSVTQTTSGHATTTDLSPSGNTVAVPAQLQTVTVPPPPASLLPVPMPASIQSLGLAGSAATSSLSSGGNEVTSSYTAATFTVQTTAPVPTSIPSGPPPCLTTPQNLPQCLPSLIPSGPGGGLPITTAPATYTLQVGNLQSRVYGFVAPASSSSGGAIRNGAGIGAPASASASGSAGRPGTPGTKPTSATIKVPGTPGVIRWPVVALAGMLEALLLAWLFLRRRSALRSRIPGPPPDSFVDLP